ncbi:CDP-diacylglycerol--glycerol-3-phosphate 3-phosphatidyltransferase [Clostridia bacterium]|nr:CDP-diacylglycerol--glycerol-3-phosphate 3-phosphatidyltransferase [Clostridia bacterium]
MNLANQLTILRIFIIPFFVFFMLSENFGIYGRWIAFILFVTAAISDFFDGFFARKYNLITNFGKFMDPLADKLLVCAALVCFVHWKQIAAWIVIVIISREFIISGFRLLAADQGIVIAASPWGKVKTAVQMVMIVILILNYSGYWFNGLKQILIYLSLFLTVISLIDYLRKNSHVLQEGRGK